MPVECRLTAAAAQDDRGEAAHLPAFVARVDGPPHGNGHALGSTFAMGGAGGEFLPPLEAPQGAGSRLTAAAATSVARVDGPPL